MTNGNDAVDATISPISGITKNKGLTKRELFAAMALQGILSNSEITNNAKNAAIKKGLPLTIDAHELISPFCKLATDFADALINALNEKP